MGFSAFFKLFESGLAEVQSHHLRYDGNVSSAPWLLVDINNIRMNLSEQMPGGHSALFNRQTIEIWMAIYNSGYRIVCFRDGKADSNRCTVKFDRMAKTISSSLSVTAATKLESADLLLQESFLFDNYSAVFRQWRHEAGLPDIHIEFRSCTGEADEDIRNFSLTCLNNGEAVTILSNDAALVLNLPLQRVSVISSNYLELVFDPVNNNNLSYFDHAPLHIRTIRFDLKRFCDALTKLVIPYLDVNQRLVKSLENALINQRSLVWIAAMLGGEVRIENDSLYLVTKFVSRYLPIDDDLANPVKLLISAAAAVIAWLISFVTQGKTDNPDYVMPLIDVAHRDFLLNFPKFLMSKVQSCCTTIQQHQTQQHQRRPPTVTANLPINRLKMMGLKPRNLESISGVFHLMQDVKALSVESVSGLLKQRVGFIAKDDISSNNNNNNNNNNEAIQNQYKLIWGSWVQSYEPSEIPTDKVMAPLRCLKKQVSAVRKLKHEKVAAIFNSGVNQLSTPVLSRSSVETWVTDYNKWFQSLVQLPNDNNKIADQAQQSHEHLSDPAASSEPLDDWEEVYAEINVPMSVPLTTTDTAKEVEKKQYIIVRTSKLNAASDRSLPSFSLAELMSFVEKNSSIPTKGLFKAENSGGLLWSVHPKDHQTLSSEDCFWNFDSSIDENTTGMTALLNLEVRSSCVSRLLSRQATMSTEIQLLEPLGSMLLQEVLGLRSGVLGDITEEAVDAIASFWRGNLNIGAFLDTVSPNMKNVTWNVDAVTHATNMVWSLLVTLKTLFASNQSSSLDNETLSVVIEGLLMSPCFARSALLNIPIIGITSSETAINLISTEPIVDSSVTQEKEMEKYHTRLESALRDIVWNHVNKNANIISKSNCPGNQWDLRWSELIETIMKSLLHLAEPTKLREVRPIGALLNWYDGHGILLFLRYSSSTTNLGRRRRNTEDCLMDSKEFQQILFPGTITPETQELFSVGLNDTKLRLLALLTRVH